MFTPRGSVFGFISTHAVTTQKGRSELSSASAFVLTLYIIITALSIYLSSGALQHTVHTSIIADKIVSLKIFFRAPIFRSGLEARSNKNSNTNPVSKKCRRQITDRVQNADCRPGTKCRPRIYTVFILITCHLTTYRASRNRFSAIIFHDLHYCGIFLARFLVTIVLNIISSLRVVFPLYARVGWCDVWTEFTNSTEVDVDVDVNEISLLNI